MGLTAPNIEAIAASLRNCSLGGRTEAQPESPTAAAAAANMLQTVEQETGERGGVMVELNSEVALPYHWEQCLDMRTGEVYYINWKDGTRTSEDPRLATALHRTSYYSSKDEISDEDDEEAEEGYESYCDAEDSSSSADDDGEDCDDFYGINTSTNISPGSIHSASPSNSDPQSAAAASTSEHVLVAAGCKSCFMYFMVSKRVEACPKCGGCLLHLGRNGCF